MSSVSSQTGRLPNRFPVGTRYVVEGRGSARGRLRVAARYLEFPNGRHVDLPLTPAGWRALPAARLRGGWSGSIDAERTSPIAKRASQVPRSCELRNRGCSAVDEKFFAARGNEPSAHALRGLTPGGVPPSPQPHTHPAIDPGPFGRRGLLFLKALKLKDILRGTRAASAIGKHGGLPDFGLASALSWRTPPRSDETRHLSSLYRDQPEPALSVSENPGKPRITTGTRTPEIVACLGCVRPPQSPLPCPMTRSSRCTMAARPPKPRMERTSADVRPLILAASSAS